MTRIRSVVVAVAGLVLAAAAIGVSGDPALAHDSLVGSTPSADQTVSDAAPTRVSLTFSASLLSGSGNVVTVTGPDGRYFETACAEVTGTDLTVPVAIGEPGTYEVQWRAVSSDGHPVSGSYAFSYAPDPASTPSVGSTGSGSSPCPGVSAGEVTAASEAGDTSTGVGLWLGLGVGAAVIVAVLAGVLWILRPRRASEEPR